MKVIDVVHQDPQECNADWVFVSVPGHSLAKKYKRFSATNWEVSSPSIPIFISDGLLEEAYQTYLKEQVPSMKVTNVVYPSTGFADFVYVYLDVYGCSFVSYKRFFTTHWEPACSDHPVLSNETLEEMYQVYLKEKAIMKDAKQTSGEKDAIALIDAMLKLDGMLCDVKDMAEGYHMPIPELSDIECRHVAVSCPFSFETVRGWFPVKNDWVGLCGHMEDTDKWFINENTPYPWSIHKSDEPTITIICWDSQKLTKLGVGKRKDMFDNFITTMTTVFGEPAWVLNSRHLHTLHCLETSFFTRSLYKKLIDSIENTVFGDIIVSYY